ncbi:2'-deoxycytidine 5'-triphosphate deaminase [Candidatus Dojkabacteria bacterium]|nr:2'-deoxycytidine 5'-triphosphate deaminase [Candidatus Dojkabacteria bacterium]
MILGISEIQKLIKEKKIIQNLSKREIEEPEGTVIDLRLDKLFRLEGSGFIGIDERKTPETIEVASFNEDETQIFKIKPQEYYLTKTVEEVNLPDNIAALFKPRSTLFRSGLILRTGFANPGYSGPLYFGLFNASQCDFQIEMGARYCSVYFMEVKGSIKNTYRGQWQGGRDSASDLEKQI